MHWTLRQIKIDSFLKQRHRHLLEHNHSQEMSRVQYDRLHSIRHQQNSCDESALSSEMCALDKGMRVLFRGVKWCWADVWQNPRKGLDEISSPRLAFCGASMCDIHLVFFKKSVRVNNALKIEKIDRCSMLAILSFPLMYHI